MPLDYSPRLSGVLPGVANRCEFGCSLFEGGRHHDYYQQRVDRTGRRAYAAA